MNKIKILVVVLIFAVVVIGVAFAQNAPRNVERWEYTVLRGANSESHFIERANELGSQGWELVSATNWTGAATFKRRLP